MAYLSFFISRELGKTLEIKKMMAVLLISLFYEVFLASWQLLKQGSLGGLWWWLGERTFSANTPFIAQAIIHGQLVLRPYATLPHPNVLSAFLVVNFTWTFFFLILQKKFQIVNTFFLFFSAFLTFFGTLFSLSRVSLLVLFGTMIALFGLKKNARLLLLAPIITGILFFSGWLNILWFRFFSLTETSAQSYQLRWILNQLAVRLFLDNPLAGVGLNHFLYVVQQRDGLEMGAVRFLQPAHSVYLLIAAETGVVGLFLLGALLLAALKKIMAESNFEIKTVKMLLLGQLLIFGLFDHYLYTLQQGLLLSAVSLGIIFSNLLLKNNRDVYQS